MLYQVGESRHNQNIQSNKIIGENENIYFILWKNTTQTFWPTQNYVLLSCLSLSLKIGYFHLVNKYLLHICFSQALF